MPHVPVELAIGHPALDRDHAELSRAIDEIATRISVGDAAGITQALQSFLEAVARHFATEQVVMEATHYPERAAHARAHQLFLADVAERVRAFEESGPGEDLATWARRRMPEWFSFHVLTNDAPLGRHLARQESRRILEAALADASGKTRAR